MAWLFKHKESPQGFDPDRYNITADEKESIANAFHNFAGPDGRRIGLEPHPPEVTRGLVAYGLWMFAEQRMDSAEFIVLTPNKLEAETVMAEAVQAIRKAHAVHRLPIYLYDMARYLQRKGDLRAARDTYREFLMAQAQYRPLTYDDIILHYRDVDQAIEDTKGQLAQIQGELSQKPESPKLHPDPPSTHRHPRAW